jgi:hypothetical protein
LCINCNTGIGKLNDDPALLRIAISYLEKWVATKPREPKGET